GPRRTGAEDGTDEPAPPPRGRPRRGCPRPPVARATHARSARTCPSARPVRRSWPAPRRPGLGTGRAGRPGTRSGCPRWPWRTGTAAPPRGCVVAGSPGSFRVGLDQGERLLADDTAEGPDGSPVQQELAATGLVGNAYPRLGGDERAFVAVGDGPEVPRGLGLARFIEGSELRGVDPADTSGRLPERPHQPEDELAAR